MAQAGQAWQQHAQPDYYQQYYPGAQGYADPHSQYFSYQQHPEHAEPPPPPPPAEGDEAQPTAPGIEPDQQAVLQATSQPTASTQDPVQPYHGWHQQPAYQQWQGYGQPTWSQPAYSAPAPQPQYPAASHDYGSTYAIPAAPALGQPIGMSTPTSQAALQPTVQSMPLQHQRPVSLAAASPAAAPRAPQPLPAQTGRRPLAQPNLNFTIKPKMPRRTLAAAAAAAAHSPATAAAAQPAHPRPQFVPVPSKAPTQSTPSSQTAAGQGSGWPASLREYVTRALKTALADPGQAAAMHNALREVISKADRAGERWSRDWDTMPLPRLGPQAQPGEAAGACAVGPAGAKREDFPDWVQARRDSAAGRSKRGRTPGKAGKAGKAARRRQASPSSSSSSPSRSPKRHLTVREEQANSARNARFGDGSVQGGRTLAVLERAHRQAKIAAVSEAFNAEDQVWDDFVIRGTCRNLEKSFFRLTAVPDPADVRPEPVLQEALARLVRLLAEGSVRYLYAVDQFKGMRQDLTVQHLRGPLAVQVYEAAARAALEYGDLPEYNQCQAQLGALYADNGDRGCRGEFLAYRLLYQVAHAGQSGGAAALMTTLRLVTAELAQQPAVGHALRVRKAAGLGEASGLCSLYGSAPNLGRALLDLVMPRARFRALQELAKACAPGLPVGHLAALLQFAPQGGPPAAGEAPGRPGKGRPRAGPGTLPGCTARVFGGKFAPAATLAEGVQACQAWLQAHQAVLSPSPSGSGELLMDCKASRSQLAVPEDTAAVAHGDALLNVSDFLKSVLS